MFDAIGVELDRAYQKHGKPVWGRHEFYAILKEEVDELWDAIKRDLPMEDLVAELIEVAAMCVRYAETGDRYRGDFADTLECVRDQKRAKFQRFRDQACGS